MSDMLIWSPCFLQNSSKDLSVTKGSSTFNLPLQMKVCTWATVLPSRSAARSQEYASCFAIDSLILPMLESSKQTSLPLHNLSSEWVVTRGSRTLSMPLPMKCLSLAGLTRSNFRNARCDQPSETLALMPSAPRRKRTARTERPRRCAILLTGSYPPQSNNRASPAAVQGREAGPELRLAGSQGGAPAGGG